MTFLLLFEDLRCFHYLSISVEQQTGIEISGIRPDIRYPAPTGYPAGNPVSGFPNGKTAIWSIPIKNIYLQIVANKITISTVTKIIRNAEIKSWIWNY